MMSGYTFSPQAKWICWLRAGLRTLTHVILYPGWLQDRSQTVLNTADAQVKCVEHYCLENCTNVLKQIQFQFLLRVLAYHCVQHQRIWQTATNIMEVVAHWCLHSVVTTTMLVPSTRRSSMTARFLWPQPRHETVRHHRPGSSFTTVIQAKDYSDIKVLVRAVQTYVPHRALYELGYQHV